jgi:hypothetical protein
MQGLAGQGWITRALPAGYVRSVPGQIGVPALVIRRGGEVWLWRGSSLLPGARDPWPSGLRMARS